MDLKTWMSVSRSRSNLVAVAATALLMSSLFILDHSATEHLAVVRRTAMFMMTVHALFHVMSLVALRSMVLRGVDNAELALSFYRHPRRISHLDLSVAWIGLFSAAPYLV
jgi:hypothetical protein